MKEFKLYMALICCITMLCFACQADASPPCFEVKTTADSITTDDTFYLLVDLKDNTGFGALQFSIEYDKDKLLLESVSSGDLLPKDIITSTNTDIDGEIHFSAISIQNIEGNGTLLVSKFKVTDKGLAKFDFKLLAYADSAGVSLNSTTNDAEIVIEGTENSDDEVPSEEETPTEDTKEEKPSSPKPTGGAHSGNSSDKNSVKDEEKTEEKIEEKNEEKIEGKIEEQPIPQEPVKISFSDVSEKHWAYAQIHKVAEMGLFSGTGENNFSPELPMTRAMFVTVLYRYAGSPESEKADFKDIEDSWYTDAVSWAAQNGIVSGIGDNLFAPHKNITRGEISTILFRYKNGKSIDINSINGFNDSGQIPDWGKEPVSWAVEQGLIMGRPGGIIAFSDNATRAEAAVIFTRFLNVE